jgi:hypothetical protein
MSLRCLIGIHAWERADTFPGSDLDLARMNEEQWVHNQRWMVERCRRCGRVENWAYGIRSRSEHLEVRASNHEKEEG